MLKQFSIVVAAAALFLSAGTPVALGQEPAAQKEKAAAEGLKVGAKAPAIDVAKFVKGEPITSFEKGQIYVVEFWATWCGPCKEAIPHVTELQKQYKDKGVHMLGVSVWENSQDSVEPFVQKMGDKMNYTVAMDNVPKGKKGNDGAMSKAWMEASGQGGIPTSFLIDKEGKIAWIGHPMELEGVLKQVVAGTFDPAKEAERAKREAAAQRDMVKFKKALDKGDTETAATLGKKLLEALDQNSMALNEIAWSIVDPDAGIKNPDLDLAMKAAKRASDLTENKDPMILDTLARVHFAKGDVDKAIELQTKAVELTPAARRAEIQKSLDEYKAKKK